MPRARNAGRKKAPSGRPAGGRGRAPGRSAAPAGKRDPRRRPQGGSRQAQAARAREAARRRAIQRLAGMGALAALLVVALAVGIRFVISRLNAHDEAAKEVPSDLYSPVACNPNMVETTIKPRNAAAGQPVVFDVTLHNKSTTNPCYINAGWSNLQVNVTSGSAQVASLAACKAGPENRQLLLDRNYTASVRLTWHGKASASGCGNSGETAKAGTYVAELTFQDKTAAAAKESFTLG